MNRLVRQNTSYGVGMTACGNPTAAADSWDTWLVVSRISPTDRVEPDDDEQHTEIERLWPKTVRRGDPSRGERTRRKSKVAGELVEAHGEPALRRTHQINLHDHCRGPGQSLTDPQQHVGEQHPVPAWRPHEQKGYGCGNEPPDHEDALTP